MKIKFITRKQEQEEHLDMLDNMEHARQQMIFLGRCLKVIREVYNWIPQIDPSKVCIPPDLMAHCKSLLERE